MTKKSTIICIAFFIVACSVEQKQIVGKIDIPIEDMSKKYQIFGFEKIAKSNKLSFYYDESSNGKRIVKNLTFYTKNNCVISFASNFANEQYYHFTFFKCDDASWNDLYNDLKLFKRPE